MEWNPEHQSVGYRNMQKRKWMTLIGSTIAVASSTVAYVNAILCFTSGSSADSVFWANPWLNVLVFGSNLDSILNDVGMFIASGFINSVPLKAFFSMPQLTNPFTNSAASVAVEPTAILPTKPRRHQDV